VQSFNRALCRALVEPYTDLYTDLRAEPCVKLYIDIQTYRYAAICSGD